MTEGRALRLIAEDTADLEIISSAVQDSVLKAENLKYDRKRRRFTLEVNRFQWEDSKSKRGPRTRVERERIFGFGGGLRVGAGSLMARC